MRVARIVLCASLSLALLGLRGSRDLPALDGYTITWEPEHPLEGSLVRVILTPRPGRTDAPARIRGALAGEPLHFERTDAGGLTAVAAVPLDSPDSTRLALVAVPARETTFVSIAVTARATDLERLRVAERFVRPPDSALAVRLRREQRLVRRVLRTSHERPRLWREPFAQPRSGRITSPFGQSRELNQDSSVRRHRGTDFDGERGAPVRAANRGVAALVADLYYAGTTVYLDHGAGLTTGYLHLDRAAVAVGDTVEREQLIGHVGASGRVTGPHLHWSAFYGRVVFDPLDLLTLPAAP